MTPPPVVRYSVLDLASILPGQTAADTFRNSLDLARHVEGLGYTRYWLAEHHNIPGIASAATSVVIGYIAGGTKSIRVGAGGIMLPNHAPLVIAEQFGTLESLYPGRIDLGLGRAPGGDSRTARALRRTLGTTGDEFPEQLEELQSYFRKASSPHAVRAIPGEGLNVPIYILGSSDFGARLAADKGLPFAFASHFAPDYLTLALQLYRDGFHPSDQLQQPYAMVGVNAFVADTDEEAHRLFTSLQQVFLHLIRNTREGPQPPVDSMEGRWSPAEEHEVNRMTAVSVVGSPSTAREQIEAILEHTHADELIFTSHIFDHVARKRSFELVADVMRDLAPLSTAAQTVIR